MRDLRKPAWIAPLALESELERSAGDAPLSVRFALASMQRHMLVEGKGSFTPDARRARAQLRIEPLAIDGQAVRLAARVAGDALAWDARRRAEEEATVLRAEAV